MDASRERFADHHRDRAHLTTRDNAAAESFWATLKVEFYDRYLWPSRAAAKLAVGDWIERVYNRRRRFLGLVDLLCDVA
jgi:putative transposase